MLTDNMHCLGHLQLVEEFPLVIGVQLQANGLNLWRFSYTFWLSLQVCLQRIWKYHNDQVLTQGKRCSCTCWQAC